MGKDSKYPEFIGANITVEQAEKVKKSDMSNAEYLRAAIDFFDEVRLNSNLEYKLRIIDECIDILKGYKRSLKDEHDYTFKLFGGNLKKMSNSGKTEGENLKGQPPLVYKEPTNQLKDSERNLKGEKNLKGQTFKKNDENLKDGVTEENTAHERASWDEVKNTLIRITHVKGRPSDNDFQFQAERCGKTTKEVKEYYMENQQFFIQESERYY